MTWLGISATETCSLHKFSRRPTTRRDESEGERAERAPRGRLKALCDVMEPLIRHGNEMKSSEIDTPRPKEGQARGDSQASFIMIRSDFVKAAIP